jgi:hypothetical protein
VVGVDAQNVTGLTITGGTIVGFSSGIRFFNTPQCPCHRGNCHRQPLGHWRREHHGRSARRQQGHEQRGSGIDISLNSDANRVVGNTVTGNRNFDLADNNLPACVNTWQGNAFVTDNEGNGPGRAASAR